jgi:XRE family transcriptional regulator, aerobic/anaerobic benzoate catabolism transcriptional regulator
MRTGTPDVRYMTPSRTPATPVLITLSQRARALRLAHGLTQRAVAERSGVSLRFLMDVEAGRGNISVRRLADLAAALQTTVADLLTSRTDAAPPRIIALVGLRGAGKTEIGRRLARRLKIRFIELDREIEVRAGLSLGEIFSLHGEEYYRGLERQTLAELLASRQSMVLAAGGGLVTSADTYALLLQHATTVWLKARADDHWNRVIRQGDRRPMDQHPQARQALRQLLTRREALYARANITVETSGLSIPHVVDRVERAVRSDLR